MFFVHDLNGASEIQRDVPVYDAASLSAGELIMLGVTDPDSNADHNIAFVTAYTGANTEAVDALGILLEGSAVATTVGALPDVGGCYLKAIINPGAVYRAEYSQAAADDVAVTTGATTTTLTITSLEDDIDCGWVFFPLASGGAAGKLRFISAAAAGSLTMDAAVTTTTDDTIIKILPQNHRTTNLTADGMKLKSQAAIGEGVSLHVLNNYVQLNSQSEITPLIYATHKNRNDMSNAKFYADLVMRKHVYRTA